MVRRGDLAVLTRCKDGDLVAASPQPCGEVTDMLGDTTRMRVVICGDQADLHDWCSRHEAMPWLPVIGYPLANARTADRPMRAQLRPIR